ncbi:hypothetical protein L210DRAFT_3193109 [Boletus edulis BED1]|uniref:DUF6535 domain-containing protein n=1 Tax=Boletus edulis BED1 TaxID=1328754 RepID=A0AAD4BX43_BOLED|nr:hypothetical protein L210DRAFT_3193109 [Boletus edulis BED1]
MEAKDTGSTSADEGVDPSSYDPAGNTTDKENQFWKNYSKEAGEYDKDFLLKNGTNIDGVLIFAGLFSAVSASFLVASQRPFEPVPWDPCMEWP